MKRILIIKLCCLGDLLQMLPAITALRAAYPKAQIDFLASSWVQELIRRIPVINRWIPWNEPYQTIPVWQKGISAMRMAQALKKERYDAVFIGHRSFFFSGLAWMSGIPNRIGFGSSPFLTHKVFFDAKAHESERYLKLAQSLNSSVIPPLDGGIQALSILPEDLKSAERLLAENKITGPFISIFPGGGNNPGTRMPIKQWPKEKWVELIRQSTSSILLLGDAHDAPLTSWIKSQLSLPSVNDLAGKTSFSSLIGLLFKSEKVIGGDSGPLHIAAALGKPTVMLFGPSDPRLVAPSNANVLWKQPACAPCYTPESVLDKSKFMNGEFPCHTGTHECMKNLSAEEVRAAL